MLFDPGCVVCETGAGPVCEQCAGELRPAGRVAISGPDVCSAAFELDDRSRTIIAAFKYRRQRRLARWLAWALSDLVPVAADVITWIPATPERRHRRGFDQGEELARAMSRLSGVPAARLLVRGHNDSRQTGLSRKERSVGPQLESFSDAPGLVALVDDVVTTGSSMRVGASVLRAAGAARVVAVAAAATPLRRDCRLHSLTIASSIREWT